jgi:hypothetical protein
LDRLRLEPLSSASRRADSCDGDRTADDPVFVRGLSLLRRIQPTPPAPESVKSRIWWAMARMPVRGPAGLSRQLKVAVVASVALVAGTAGAVIARGWIVPRSGPGARVSTPAVAGLDNARRVALAEPPVERPAPRPTLRRAERRPAVPTSAATAAARERSEVLDALIALRRAHDPARAGTLLSKYLAAHPRGALREEALALAIEAADARGDRAAGAQTARAYLGEFPGGRFASFARGHHDAAH